MSSMTQPDPPFHLSCTTHSHIYNTLHFFVFLKKKKSNILSILGVFLNSCCLSPEHSALIPILQVSAPQRDGHLPPYSNFSLVLSTKVITSFTVYLLILFLVCHRLHHQPMVIFLLSVCYLSCSKFPHSTKSVAMYSFLYQLQN